MNKQFDFLQTGTECALKAYVCPSTRSIPISLESALLGASAHGDEIEPGIGDNWGDF